MDGIAVSWPAPRDLKAALATSSGTNWYLTPNGNQVSTAIAAGSVGAGMKTLVFVQNTIACGSCIRAFANHLTPREVSLTEEEAGYVGP